MTELEKQIIEDIHHPTYTEEFLNEWIHRNDKVEVNAVAALQAMGAKGFYAAVQKIAKNIESKEPKTYAITVDQLKSIISRTESYSHCFKEHAVDITETDTKLYVTLHKDHGSINYDMPRTKR